MILFQEAKRFNDTLKEPIPILTYCSYEWVDSESVYTHLIHLSEWVSKTHKGVSEIQ